MYWRATAYMIALLAFRFYLLIAVFMSSQRGIRRICNITLAVIGLFGSLYMIFFFLLFPVVLTMFSDAEDSQLVFLLILHQEMSKASSKVILIAWLSNFTLIILLKREIITPLSKLHNLLTNQKDLMIPPDNSIREEKK